MAGVSRERDQSSTPGTEGFLASLGMTVRGAIFCITLGLDPQQLGGIGAENQSLVGGVQARYAENGIDLVGIAHKGIDYVERKIRAHKDMACANFSDQMAQALGSKHNRIAIQLSLEIFAGMFFDWVAMRALLHAVIRSATVRGEVASAMGAANLDARVAVQRPFEDQMGERHRSLQGIAYYIGQESVPLKAPLSFREAGGMDENEDSQLFGLGPERIKLGRREILPVRASADFEPAHA